MDKKILTVEQVNRYIKKSFDTDYLLKNLWIKGEVSNCKYHSSGHVYFTLKDNYSALSCVMFSRYSSQISVKIKDGMSLIAGGAVSVYERSGNYQLYVRDIIEEGTGTLHRKYEAMKLKLEKEGLFLEEHKKTIPFYPRKVGIVTSRTGAAIMDMVQVAKRRNPFIQLVLYPSLVQGDGAKESIVNGINYLDKLEEIDVIIIGRGGGSIEDLWAFNEEAVARAVYACQTPIIAAVGHETDFTIADFVADLRAPTPSAGAELAIQPIEDINNLLYNYKSKFVKEMQIALERKKQHLEIQSIKLDKYHPRFKIEQLTQYLIDLECKLKQLLKQSFARERHKLSLLEERLKNVSILEHLKNGYVFVTNQNGKWIQFAKDVKEEEALTIQFYDGQVVTKVVTIDREKGVTHGE